MKCPLTFVIATVYNLGLGQDTILKASIQWKLPFWGSFTYNSFYSLETSSISNLAIKSKMLAYASPFVPPKFKGNATSFESIFPF